ncbi:MAG: family 78 glycoside hydrolase catalytic domain [Candidatus Hydrogenedentota bacterium]
MQSVLILFALVCVFLSAAFPAAAQAKMDAAEPVDLRVEHRVNPLGIATTEPRLSWRLRSRQAGCRQTAYRVIVATDKGKLEPDKADLWDSGKVASDVMMTIYAGKPLAGGQRCYWTVQVWDEAQQPGAWPAAQTWSMGLGGEDAWEADWISYEDARVLEASPETMVLPPAHYFRKEFAAKNPVERATLYATALGNADFHINGERVTEARFLPGWTDYAQRVYYHTFDVTDAVEAGDNALGAILADGWYAGYLGYGLLVGYGPDKCGRYFYGKTPALMMQLELVYGGGARETVVTDPGWKVSTGAYHAADHLMGETVDARDQPAGWSTPRFDDTAWESAVPASRNGELRATYHDAGGEKEVDLGFAVPPVIEPYPMQHVLPVQVLQPQSIEQRAHGKYIVDFGQNFAGVIRLHAQGAAGTKITIRHGEMLHPDGRLMTENLRKARATDTFILRGDPDGETYEPRFTYHGFQYAEISGYPGALTVNDIEGVVLGSDTPLTSSWGCNDPVLNQFYSNVVWTQRANFLEVPTDCPQRDERFGWTGDAQVYARAATYNADVAAFFAKWLQDLRDAQTPAGAYPDYAPYPMQHGGSGKPYATAWTDAGVIVPWRMYQAYGDTHVLREHYPSMQKFIEFRRETAPDFMGTKLGNGWGDWLSMGEETPIPYIDHCYYAWSAKLVAQMAAVLGETKDAADYSELHENVKTTFIDKYVNGDGTLTIDTQTAYVLALDIGLIPEDRVAAAADRLVAKIVANDRRMTTGFLGTRPLLPVLTKTGHFELAVELMQSRRFPSWGYAVEQGATSIWERWNSYTIEDGFQEGMNSFNHYAFGAVVEWLYGTLAGIKPIEPGYARVLIHPHVPMQEPVQEGVPMLDRVAATYESIRGEITSAWTRDGAAFTLEVTIPANTRAEVVVPVRAGAQVMIDGTAAEHVEGITVMERNGARRRFAVPAGKYSFVSKLPS